MLGFWLSSSRLRNGIYIPKYYDPELAAEIQRLGRTHHLVVVGDLVRNGVIELATGDEIGSDAYGTGNIPFVRTSDISNWEIKTAPKLGVSEAVYQTYAAKQDVREKDILLVRDGTYLIGTNCFVTSVDAKLLYQSHILKVRVNGDGVVTPESFFLALNSDVVQRQIKSVQFTADIIDTIGGRFTEVVLPIPRDPGRRTAAEQALDNHLATRARGKCFIKQAPMLVEEALRRATTEPLETFLQKDTNELAGTLTQDTVSLEFGGFEATWVSASAIQDQIFIPKYYDPEIDQELAELSETCELRSIGELRSVGLLRWDNGHEPGKMAYGTGDIPFIRTSDFANWEIKHDPKQGMAEHIYELYRELQDVAAGDVLVVRDGTYLVGSSTIVHPGDEQLVFCGGLYRLRSLKPDELSPFLLLALLNSYVVKRQIRSKQFTRDVIDTVGRRLDEVRLPVPKSVELRQKLASVVREVLYSRVAARDRIKNLSQEFVR